MTLVAGQLAPTRDLNTSGDHDNDLGHNPARTGATMQNDTEISFHIQSNEPLPETILSGLERRVSGMSRFVAGAGMVLMLLVSAFLVADVVVFRFLLGAPLTASNEIFRMVFSVAIAATLASGLAENATLKVDILKARLPVAAQRMLVTIGATIYLGLLAALACGMVSQTLSTWSNGNLTTILRMPIWPFHAAISCLLFLTLPAQALAILKSSRKQSLAAAVSGIVAGVIILVAGTWAVTTSQAWILGHPIAAAGIAFVILWVAILLCIPVAATLLAVAGLGATGMFGLDTALKLTASEMTSLLTSADLAIIPLFLLMGGFAVASGMSADIYRLAQALFSPLRGGLAMATVGGCAGFGALTGSSVATVATIGGAAYPEMKQRGYARPLSTGAIAAGGTLGQLIPPSTAVVVYALLVEESIGRLYMAILLPAVLTVALYLIAINLSVRLRPGNAPGREAWSSGELWSALRQCGPAGTVFALVIGGIFFGVFTATEAAAVGALLAFATAVWRGALSKGRFWLVAGETVQSTSMLYFVILGAMVLTFFMSTTGAASVVTQAILGSGLPDIAVLILLALIFVLLGSVMDSMTIMMITASTMAGVITAMGYDLIWWGVIMVMLVELGVITPPFGINLFVMKSVAPDARLADVYRGVLPFVLVDLLKIAILILFPAIVLWLPSLT